MTLAAAFGRVLLGILAACGVGAGGRAARSRPA